MQRLSPGTLILGIFAILFGLVGAFAVKQHLLAQQTAPAQKPAEQTFSIPVAVADLPAGRTIAPTDLSVTKMTAKQIADAKFPSSYMDKAAQIIGRTLRDPVKQWTPFEPKIFYPEGIGPSLSDRLGPGQRAVAISFMGSAAEAGLITPGAMVDVVFRAAGNGKQIPAEATMTLLSKIKVLAVGQNTQEGLAKGTSNTVTLAVSDLQAQALKSAEDHGVFSLALRNAKDESIPPKAPPIILHELLGLKQNGHTQSTQIYRRGQLTTVSFDEEGKVEITSAPPYGLPVAEAPEGQTVPVVPAVMHSEAGAALPARGAATNLASQGGSRGPTRATRVTGAFARNSQ